MAIDKLWLPEGHHYDLHIEHLRATLGAGPFTGGGWKICWHITVSPWTSAKNVAHDVCQRRVEPHFVIGGQVGREHPVVYQLLALNVAGRSLAHPSGPETNKANCIQIEVCAYPDTVKAFTDWHYKALGNLSALIEHRVPVPCKVPRSFKNTKRFTGAGFVKTAGHVGHMHVPGNDHYDPTTAFKGARLCRFQKSAPNDL
jgi:hypothetical protein